MLSTLIIAAAITADGITERFVEQVEANRFARISEMPALIKEARARMVAERKSGNGREAANEIKRLEDEQKILQTAGIDCLTLCAPRSESTKLTDGQVIYFPNSAARVIEVIGRRDILIRLTNPVWLGGVDSSKVNDDYTVSLPEYLVASNSDVERFPGRPVIKLTPYDLEPARKLWLERHPAKTSRK